MLTYTQNVSLQFSIAKQVGWAKPRWGIRFYGDVALTILGEAVAKAGGGLMLEGLETGELGMCGILVGISKYIHITIQTATI
jgi:hypothetical protein